MCNEAEPGSLVLLPDERPSAGGLPPPPIGTPRARVDRSPPERTQRVDRRVVALSHQARPAAAVQEQVIEGDTPKLAVVDRLDQGEPVAKPAAAAAGPPPVGCRPGAAPNRRP